jgi:hypothetical protein
MSSPWLLEESVPLDAEAEGALGRDLRKTRSGIRRLSAPPLAISMHDIMIHDNKKWFGGADLRLDALIVQGHGSTKDSSSFYTPQTFRFPAVRDGERLPIGESGLLVYYGRPAYFLDLFITVSRDRTDSDDLAKAFATRLTSGEADDAIGNLVSLVAQPQVAAVKAAIGAAARLGELAYEVLRAVTGSTVGLLHTSWLEHRDGFGVGRHPDSAAYRLRDLSFWYEIGEERQTTSVQ